MREAFGVSFKIKNKVGFFPVGRLFFTNSVTWLRSMPVLFLADVDTVLLFITFQFSVIFCFW